MLQFTTAYAWEGVSSSGKRLAGIQIGSQLEVIRRQLQRQGVIVTKLRRTSRIVLTRYHITPHKIAYFTRQLAYLLQADFALLPALDCLMQQYPSAALMQSLLMHLKSALENGMTLSSALRQYPEYFDDLYCHLIAVSEQCGNLAEQLLQLSEYQEKLLAIKHNIYKALYYPMSLISMATLVILFLVLWIVPQFEALFASVGATLPILTRALINSVRYARAYGRIIIMSGLLLGGVLTLFRKSFSRWNVFIKELTLKLPWIGPVLHQAVYARFARTLSTTLTAGLPLLQALEATKSVVQYTAYRAAIFQASEALRTGASLSQALAMTQRFPSLLIQTIATGQVSGYLAKNLGQLAGLLETQMHESITQMIRVLEPMLLLILGIVIGVLMLALYLPIFELGNVVGLS
jgi:type IV pilus assembly protein PilC